MAKYNIGLLRQITILFAEDEEDVRTSQLEVYNRLFKKVYSAANGKEAIEVFLKNKNEIDVIITDINMPDFDGLQVASKIRENPTVPIILATDHTDSKYTLQAIDLKIDKYLVKPVTLNEILSAVETTVEFHKKEEQEKLISQNLQNNS